MNEKFSGFNTSVEEFFELYEDVAAINNWNDATKLIVMPMYLSGPAFYYYKTMKLSSTTYNELKFFFRREFGELDCRSVQTGPPPSEQTAEQRNAEPLVESELEQDENSDYVAPISTTELKTDQAPVERAPERNEKHHDEAAVSTSTAELSSHIKEEKIDPQDENKETKPQDENLLKNKKEEKTSLSSVTADSKSENYSDSEKSENQGGVSRCSE